MAYWKTGFRKIDGHRRKVRKLVVGGKITSVRIANRNHFTDKTARRMGRYRVRGYVNNPNAARRRDYHVHSFW